MCPIENDPLKGEHKLTLTADSKDRERERGGGARKERNGRRGQEVEIMEKDERELHMQSFTMA